MPCMERSGHDRYLQNCHHFFFPRLSRSEPTLTTSSAVLQHLALWHS